MSEPISIVAMIGSLRAKSLNRHLFNAYVSLAPEGTTVTEAPIGGLPLFNDDVDVAGPPQAVTLFREQVAAAHGLLLITPEYNHTIPGVLKNAIDWASRPSGKAAILGKPIALAGVSSGRAATLRAQIHTRAVYATLDLKPLNKPEVAIGDGGGKFDENGVLTDEHTTELLSHQLLAFKAWIERLRA